jgi:hypothetical protein
LSVRLKNHHKNTTNTRKKRVGRIENDAGDHLQSPSPKPDKLNKQTKSIGCRKEHKKQNLAGAVQQNNHEAAQAVHNTKFMRQIRRGQARVQNPMTNIGRRKLETKAEPERAEEINAGTKPVRRQSDAAPGGSRRPRKNHRRQANLKPAGGGKTKHEKISANLLVAAKHRSRSWRACGRTSGKLRATKSGEGIGADPGTKSSRERASAS